MFFRVPDACIAAPEESFTCSLISPLGAFWARTGGVKERSAQPRAAIADLFERNPIFYVCSGSLIHVRSISDACFVSGHGSSRAARMPFLQALATEAFLFAKYRHYYRIAVRRG
jgi:hypothetical protein